MENNKIYSEVGFQYNKKNASLCLYTSRKIIREICKTFREKLRIGQFDLRK